MDEQILDQNLGQSSENIDFDAKCQKLVNEGYEFKFGEYISQGFDIFKKNIGGFIGYTLLLFAFSLIASLLKTDTIGYGSVLFNLFLAPPLGAGFFIVGKKIIHEEPYEFKDFFKGFDYYGQLFVGNLVMSIFVIIGTILLIIPGIYLAVSYVWLVPFILFAGYEFWPAMESSRKIITKKWFTFFGFLIVLGLINILGLIALGVGILVTAPATIMAILAAFHDIVGTKKEA